MKHLLLLLLLASTAQESLGYPAAAPESMRAVRASSGCGAPFECVHIQQVATPKPAHGAALIQIRASSVNPSDVDTIEEGGCGDGCGADLAGTVVECSGCKRLKPGDAVWSLGGPAYADYIAVCIMN